MHSVLPRRLIEFRKGMFSDLMGCGNCYTDLGRASAQDRTQTHREQFDFAQSEFEDFKTRLKTLSEKTVPSFEEDVIAAGGPWVPGGKIP